MICGRALNMFMNEEGWRNHDTWSSTREYKVCFVSVRFLLNFLTGVILCQFYSHVYNYCTSVHQQGQSSSQNAPGAAPSRGGGSNSTSGRNVRGRIGTSTNNSVNQNSGAQFVGQELYKRLNEFLRSYLLKLVQVCFLK